jgi:predicted RNA-binding protein with PIN domain
VLRTIVDGYNLLFREREASPGASLRDLREELVRRIDAARPAGRDITIVFDGRPGPGVRSERPAGLRVLYSRSPRTADDLIVSLVEKAPRGQTIVVTRDRELARRVKAAGGRLGSPEELFRPPRRRKPGRGGTRPGSGKPEPPTGAALDEWERLFEDRDAGESTSD